MDIDDMVINKDLLETASLMGRCCDDKWKWYLHLQYITYIEGVVCFLRWAAETDNGQDTVKLLKKDLIRLSGNLFKTDTYHKK